MLIIYIFQDISKLPLTYYISKLNSYKVRYKRSQEYNSIVFIHLINVINIYCTDWNKLIQVSLTRKVQIIFRAM